MKINSIEDLVIWQEAREFSKLVIEITKSGSFSKDFRFKDQIRAAAGSVMDNISEGFGRGGNKEFIQFLCIAKGSCYETRSQLYRAFDSEYISESQLNDLLHRAESIARKIQSFIDYLKKSEFKGHKYQ